MRSLKLLTAGIALLVLGAFVAVVQWTPKKAEPDLAVGKVYQVRTRTATWYVSEYKAEGGCVSFLDLARKPVTACGDVTITEVGQ